ncbi:MAG: alpha/beta hydrolase [bacterium]
MFSHGLLMNLHMYDAQVAELSARYRCVAYDHRGQGQSDVPSGPMIDMETCYDDAATLIETIGGGRVHFVGLSMGGFVGLRLAARRPDLIASVTLIDTSAEPEPLQNVPKYRRLVQVARRISPALVTKQVLPLMFGDAFLHDDKRRDEVQTWTHHLRANPRSIYKAVNGVIYRPGVVAEARQITVPARVIHGTHDRAIPRHVAQRLADIVNGELVLIEGAGHSPTIESPHATTSAIEEFLAEHRIDCNAAR